MALPVTGSNTRTNTDKVARPDVECAVDALVKNLSYENSDALMRSVQRLAEYIEKDVTMVREVLNERFPADKVAGFPKVLDDNTPYHFQKLLFQNGWTLTGASLEGQGLFELHGPDGGRVAAAVVTEQFPLPGSTSLYVFDLPPYTETNGFTHLNAFVTHFGCVTINVDEARRRVGLSVEEMLSTTEGQRYLADRHVGVLDIPVGETVALNGNDLVIINTILGFQPLREVLDLAKQQLHTAAELWDQRRDRFNDQLLAREIMVISALRGTTIAITSVLASLAPAALTRGLDGVAQGNSERRGAQESPYAPFSVAVA